MQKEGRDKGSGLLIPTNPFSGELIHSVGTNPTNSILMRKTLIPLKGPTPNTATLATKFQHEFWQSQTMSKLVHQLVHLTLLPVVSIQWRQCCRHGNVGCGRLRPVSERSGAGQPASAHQYLSALLLGLPDGNLSPTPGTQLALMSCFIRQLR
jgi:hypothetical protein